MPSLPGAPFTNIFDDFVNLLRLHWLQQYRNIYPIYHVGEYFTLVMFLLLVGSIVVPLIYILPFEIDQVFFKFNLLLSNFAQNTLFGYFRNTIQFIRLPFIMGYFICSFYVQIFHIYFIFPSRRLFKSFSQQRFPAAIS